MCLRGPRAAAVWAEGFAPPLAGNLGPTQAVAYLRRSICSPVAELGPPLMSGGWRVYDVWWGDTMPHSTVGDGWLRKEGCGGPKFSPRLQVRLTAAPAKAAATRWQATAGFLAAPGNR